MISLLLMALTVVPVNDPLAPLQLLHADVTAHGGEFRVCVTVRNESPQIVDNVQIGGSIHDESQSVTGFFTGAPATVGKSPGVAPGGQFRACASVPGVVLHGNASVQVTIK